MLSILFEEWAKYGNHPYTTFTALVVDTRSGQRWTTSAIVTAVQRSARPGVDLLTEIRRGVSPSSYDQSLIGFDDTELAPTRGGLHFAIDQCTIVCVAGPIEGTIAWSQLLAPGAPVPFAPW
ncbi:MAG: hypothetical protein U0Q19_22310 [Kineosporiaceae bacterium]|mgnify:FL=1